MSENSSSSDLSEIDILYEERAHALSLAAVQQIKAGDARVCLAPAPDVDEPGWWVLFLWGGANQMTWHICPRDVDLFHGVPRVAQDDPRARWDGHLTPEKYARLRAYVAYLAKRCGVPE